MSCDQQQAAFNAAVQDFGKNLKDGTAEANQKIQEEKKHQLQSKSPVGKVKY